MLFRLASGQLFAGGLKWVSSCPPLVPRFPAGIFRRPWESLALGRFDTPDLGGTDFYRSCLSASDTDQLVADSQRLDAERFSARYGITPGYMTPERAAPYFEHVAYVPAAWNRMICYDGGLFHSARVALTHGTPTACRLTLNGFYTCTRRLV